jgi:hypothetical protein
MSTLLAIGLMAGLPAVASAQEGARKHGKKEALLKKFDKDGDGKLSRQERAAAREFRRDHRGEKGGARPEDLRKRILRRFDSDGDQRLNKGEREALRKFLESPRPRSGRKGRR